jgi:hypothetical protein
MVTFNNGGVKAKRIVQVAEVTSKDGQLIAKGVQIIEPEQTAAPAQEAVQRPLSEIGGEPSEGFKQRWNELVTHFEEQRRQIDAAEREQQAEETWNGPDLGHEPS